MNNVKKYLIVLLIIFISGCSTNHTRIKLSSLSNQIDNPYLKHLSQEPYWHYNFYPEPRWEYTYGLYSFPYNAEFEDLKCVEIDRPYWHGRHDGHEHGHHHNHHHKPDANKHDHEGANPEKPLPVKPIGKNSSTTPPPGGHHLGKTPFINKPPLASIKPPMVKSPHVQDQSPVISPGAYHPGHTQKHVNSLDDSVKPLVLTQPKAYGGKPTGIFNNANEADRHHHEKNKQQEHTKTRGLIGEVDGHQNPQPILIHEPSKTIPYPTANASSNFEKTPPAAHIQSVVTAPPVSVRKEHSDDPLNNPKEKSAAIVESSRKEHANTLDASPKQVTLPTINSLSANPNNKSEVEQKVMPVMPSHLPGKASSSESQANPIPNEAQMIVEKPMRQEKTVHIESEHQYLHHSSTAIEPPAVQMPPPKIEPSPIKEKPVSVAPPPPLPEMKAAPEPPAPLHHPETEPRPVHENSSTVEPPAHHVDKVIAEPAPIIPHHPAAEPQQAISPAPAHEKPAHTEGKPKEK